MLQKIARMMVLVYLSQLIYFRDPKWMISPVSANRSWTKTVPISRKTRDLICLIRVITAWYRTIWCQIRSSIARIMTRRISKRVIPLTLFSPPITTTTKITLKTTSHCGRSFPQRTTATTGRLKKSARLWTWLTIARITWYLIEMKKRGHRIVMWRRNNKARHSKTTCKPSPTTFSSSVSPCRTSSDLILCRFSGPGRQGISTLASFFYMDSSLHGISATTKPSSASCISKILALSPVQSAPWRAKYMRRWRKIMAEGAMGVRIWRLRSAVGRGAVVVVGGAWRSGCTWTALKEQAHWCILVLTCRRWIPMSSSTGMIPSSPDSPSRKMQAMDKVALMIFWKLKWFRRVKM